MVGSITPPPPPPSTVTVPNLVGMTWSEAKQVLQGLGLQIIPAAAAEYKVLSQAPFAGTTLAIGGVVTVTLSPVVVPPPTVGVTEAQVIALGLE